MRLKFFLFIASIEVLIKQMGIEIQYIRKSAYFCVVSTVIQHIIPFKTVT